MTLSELLVEVQEKRIGLSIRSGELIVRGEEHILADSLLIARLRENKQALLEWIEAGGSAGADGFEAPANRIPPGCDAITPEMLPLAHLTREDVDRIVSTVPGGAINVQDIYPLAPLQQGILFHYATRTEGDPYLLECRLRFDSRERLDTYVRALQAVIDRHDLLRTAVLWEGLSEPVQVVWRHARLPVEEVRLAATDGDILQQLTAGFDARQYPLDVRQAPLMRGLIAEDAEERGWLLLLVFHHLACDHTTLRVIQKEIEAELQERAEQLPKPVPFRNFVARARLGVSQEEHAAFFRAMLSDVDVPTAPFGLMEVQSDGSRLAEERRPLGASLAKRLRERARMLGVSAASCFHVAWALVLARLCGRDDVVFGTVLLGRMQGGTGAEQGVGMFINTLPVRIRVSEAGVEDVVRRTHYLLAELLRHEHAPLALAQRASAVAAPTPLFTTLLNYRHGEADAGKNLVLHEGIELLGAGERTNYPLTLSVDDLGESFALNVQARSPIDPRRIALYVESVLERLTEALEREPGMPIERLDALPASERCQLLNEWNATRAEYPEHLCVHELFEEQVRRTPNALAAIHEQRELSYAELNARANRLAHHLRSLGVQPDARVAICMDRSLELLLGVLAISKAGGAYVPLDPSYPAERLRYMLRDSAPVLMLTDARVPSALRAAFEECLPATRVLDLQANAARWCDEPSSNLERRTTGLSPTHLVYVIYTSGSTGRPKGVMVEHRNLVNLVSWHREAFELTAGERASSVASVGFDAAAWEIWAALSSGATLVLPPSALARDPEALLSWWRCQKLDVSFLPTPLAEYVLSAGLAYPELRILLTGGDRLRQRPKAGQSFSLINNYGPTETTVVATSGKLEASDSVLHIGRPIANARIYILDARREPVPSGVEGEIYIGGAGVARGYLNQAELTAERFVQDPFAERPDARMYRSGDLARYLPDGNIEFLGRNDAQVKIRGFRIELSEIEARLAEHPAIQSAVVLARADDAGDQQLVTYYTRVAAIETDAEALRAHLSAVLPAYMVPFAYVELDALPLTANGKLDIKALPAPERASSGALEYQPPIGEIESTLAKIWAEVLQVERVGRHDQFFQLGGHSLLALSLIERMRQAGLHADVRTLFATPTLSALAAAASRNDSACSEAPARRIPPNCTTITSEMLPLIELTAEHIAKVVAAVLGGAMNVADIYPLAPLQEGILFHHLMETQGDAYLLEATFGFSSRERLDAYLGALQAVVDRHDLLRTAVLWEGLPEPLQVVWRRAPLVVEEVAFDPVDGDVLEQLTARFDARLYRLDVRRAPLLRALVTRDEVNARWLLLLLFHHLAGDHATLAVIEEEIVAHLEGRALQLPEPVPFRNFVAQARLGLTHSEHAAFFRALLGDVDAPTAPFGLLDVQGDGSSIAEGRRPVAESLAKRVRERARALGVSPASLFHVAWAQVLARLSGRDDVVFGTVLLGRLQGGRGAERAVGMFINTLPLRIRVNEERVEDVVRNTQALLAELVLHEHAPLALAQRSSAVPAPLPLFTTLLNYRHEAEANATATQRTAPHWAGIEFLGGRERTNYPLTLSVDDLGDNFAFRAQVVQSIDPQRICAFMDSALEHLVEALESTPGAALDSLEVLPADERRRVLEDWNQSPAAGCADVCIHELFEAQAARMPEAIAAEHEGRELSYGELNARANQLAHYLRRLGVKPDERVAVCVERGLEMLVGLLAISKASGAYVPLDPAYPAERLGFMLEDSAPRLLLTAGNALPPNLRSRSQLRVLDVETDAELWSSLPSTNPERSEPGLSPEHLVYVIYTSGSTGRPKGVMVEHRNLVNLVNWHRGAFELAAGERASSVASVGFDAAAWEVWSALSAGATLVLPAAEVGRDPQALLKWWQEQELAVSFLPTPLAELAFAGGVENPKLRTLLTGGDRLRQLPRQAPTFSVINNYGPTETTVVATSGKLQVSDRIPHMGRPIANARIYLLDADREPVPLGVAGEIYIGGAGVARGYLNQPKLTAERFLPDPFASEADARMYKSGDLGRYLPDGNIEFLGRNDEQVKIRGYRIELGEIEARLSEHAAIREGVVLAREDSPGEQRLVAYYTLASEALRAGPGELGEALRAHLSATLPEYMLPAAYVELDTLPLTVNGKLDRRALPAPDAASHSLRGYQAPLGLVESAIARIWSDVLKLGEVGRQDHFFELGGQSLLAVRVISALREALGVEVSVKELFSRPVLSDFARVVERAGPSALSTIHKVERTGNVALSFAQQRLWFLAQLPGVSQAYHLAGALRLQGTLDASALKRALDDLVARHEVLRTTFRSVDGEPVQFIAPEATGFSLVHHELRAHPGAQEELQRLAAEEAVAPFDLFAGPLIRGRLLELDADDHVLLITMHHIVSDGWSLGILLGELTELYAAHREGRGATLPALEIQYADYAAWQRQWFSGERLASEISFWQQELANAPVLLELPRDRERPAQQDHRGAMLDFELDAGLCSGLKALGQRHGATLFMTLLAGWALLLTRLADVEEVVIGSPVANRTRAEVEPLLGFFVNTLALRLDVSGSPTVAEVLERVKAKTLQAQQHQELPFEQVVELVRPPRSLAHSPIFQVMFAWQNNEEAELLLPGLKLTPIDSPYSVAKFDLTLSLREAGGRIVGGLEYASALFEPHTIERHLGYFRNLLEAMVTDDEQLARRLPLLSAPERRQLLQEWNVVEPCAAERCVHELFEAAAARAPEAIAVVHEGQTLSYGELNRRSNQLAHALRKLGVKPESRVALCLERSPEMLVGLLAILKAGGAYVPLDPSYPSERIAYMLEDSTPALVLTQPQLVERLIAAHPQLADSVIALELDEHAWCWHSEPDENLERSVTGLSPEHLQYVIYTSGSTGRPKGVMVEHANVSRLFSSTRAWLDTAQRDVWSLFHSISFDFSVWEIWGALIHGARLVIVPQQVALSPREFYALVCREGITILNQTPSAFRQLVDAEGESEESHHLRWVIFGGEALDAPSLRPWFERARNEQTRLANMYGITETTVHATHHIVTPSETERHGASLIGRRLPDLKLYLLDRLGEPVPVGVPGEIYVGGSGVARGYLNRAELTAERFLRDPFATEPGARMYKSGDLARFLPDGSLEFLGRNDTQVKIRGFRIELGEVEARLAEHPGIRDAVVLAREDIPGDQRLVAYYTLASDALASEPPLTADALRAHLSAQLPHYMLPAAYVALDALPLTANGKLNRQALMPPQGQDHVAARDYEAPRGDIEITLARIWADLLKLERVGRHDHFFELGGHSLLAVRLIAQIKQAFDVEIAVQDLFNDSALTSIAKTVALAQLAQFAPEDVRRALGTL